MKQAKLYFLLLFLPLSVLSFAQEQQDFSRQGAVRRMDCRLSYAPGSSTVVPAYGDNAACLARLGDFLSRALADSLWVVDRIELTGYCSVEGTYAANERLASRRTRGFLAYLEHAYALSGRYDIRIDSIAEDWAELRRLIAGSSYPWREDALLIIDGTDIFGGREKRLMDLKGGVPYREMAVAFFPSLRRVSVTIHYDVERSQALQEAAVRRRAEVSVRPDTGMACRYDTVAVVPDATAPVTVIPPGAEWHPKTLYPVVAVKTNLFAWAGLTPEFRYRRFTPNLAVEGFFAGRWSAVLSGAYSNWSYGGGRKWGISALSLEPRFWIDGSGRYRYLYIGAFGRLGDYNDCHDIYSLSVTGDYWQAGLSAGCYVPVVKGLGFEFGVRGGYERRDEDTYAIEEGYKYFQANRAKKRWGVLGVDIGVSWRW